jgi:hypothetical protein
MSLLPTVTNYPRYLNLFQHRENLTALNSSNFLYFTPYKLHKSIIDYITILFLYAPPPLLSELVVFAIIETARGTQEYCPCMPFDIILTTAVV